MTKPLPLTDFRALRHVLTADEYATGGEFPPPSDLIDQMLWHNMMDLPDDVAIRISDHNGTRLRLLYSLWGDWIVAVGDPGRQDELFGCMLDANDCLQCTNFDLLHGFYRAAIANLRTAFELVMIGTFANLNPSDDRYVRWKNGHDERLGFTGCRKQLLRQYKGTPVEWMFTDNAFLGLTYAELCKFTHARPNASDGALWQSNGPVYNNEAILKTFKFGLDVYSANYLLVKVGRPGFKLPADSHILFELDWMTHHAACLKAFNQLYAAGP